MPRHADVKVDGAVDGVCAIVPSDRRAGGERRAARNAVAPGREKTAEAISEALESKNEVVYFFLRGSDGTGNCEASLMRSTYRECVRETNGEISRYYVDVNGKHVIVDLFSKEIGNLEIPRTCGTRVRWNYFYRVLPRLTVPRLRRSWLGLGNSVLARRVK